jgi:hypothetical protein
MHVNPLTVQKQHTCPPMLPAAPVTPEQGSRPNFEGMQQHAHLARLRSGTALPLALLCWLHGIAVPKKQVTSCMENLIRNVDKEAKIGVVVIIGPLLWNSYPK